MSKLASHAVNTVEEDTVDLDVNKHTDVTKEYAKGDGEATGAVVVVEE